MLLEHEVVARWKRVRDLLHDRDLVDAVRDDPLDLVVVDDVDRRSRLVRLMPAGRALAERTVSAVQASDEELFAKALSAAETARLAALLRAIRKWPTTSGTTSL